MGRKSWSFVDAKVRPADVLCFVVVGAYLTVVCAYLLATRQLRAGLSVGTVVRRVAAWPGQAAGKVVRVLRRPFSGRNAA